MRPFLSGKQELCYVPPVLAYEYRRAPFLSSGVSYGGPLEVGEAQTPETLVGESPSDYRQIFKYPSDDSEYLLAW